MNSMHNLELLFARRSENKCDGISWYSTDNMKTVPLTNRRSRKSDGIKRAKNAFFIVMNRLMRLFPKIVLNFFAFAVDKFGLWSGFASSVASTSSIFISVRLGDSIENWKACAFLYFVCADLFIRFHFIFECVWYSRRYKRIRQFSKLSFDTLSNRIVNKRTNERKSKKKSTVHTRIEIDNVRHCATEFRYIFQEWKLKP